MRDQADGWGVVRDVSAAVVHCGKRGGNGTHALHLQQTLMSRDSLRVVMSRWSCWRFLRSHTSRSEIYL